MSELLTKAFELGVSTVELSNYIKKENKDFPLMQRLLKCGTGISISLRIAAALPEYTRGFYMDVIKQAEEFQCLMELMVVTGVLTKRQGEPLIADSQFIKEKALKLIKSNTMNKKCGGN